MPQPSANWSQEFALFNPLNDLSQLVLKSRLNRRHQVDATRRGLCTSRKLTSKRRTAAKLDFSMLMGRRCVSFGTSRANNITLPKGHGISNVHFYVHFDTHTKVLLLTIMPTSEVHIRSSAGAAQEKTLARGRTIPLLASTCLSFGSNEQFEFNILPTSRPATFEQLFSSWRKSVPERDLQKIRRISIQFSKASRKIHNRRVSLGASLDTPQDLTARSTLDCTVQ